VTGRPNLNVARLAVCVAGVVKDIVCPGLCVVTVGALAGPVAGRCRVARYTIGSIGVHENDLCPTGQVVALCADAVIMGIGRGVAEDAVAVGIVDDGHVTPACGGVAIGALAEPMAGRCRMAPYTVNKAGVIHGDREPGTRIVAERAALAIVPRRCRVTLDAGAGRVVLEGHVAPIAGAVTVGALAGPVAGRCRVARSAVDEAGMIHRDGQPARGVVAASALVAVMAGRHKVTGDTWPAGIVTKVDIAPVIGVVAVVARTEPVTRRRLVALLARGRSAVILQTAPTVSWHAEHWRVEWPRGACEAWQPIQSVYPSWLNQ
jgi:hypothetical protein